MHYWPALDGLRALAVIAVMLFHAQWPGAQGGFLGVDVFFVLSGFLITAQLSLEMQTTGRIALWAFFMRRVVRLQPALLLLLLAYAGCAALTDWLPPAVAGVWPTDVAVVALAMAHWARAWEWLAPDYLGHTWSLGIEEQFYLLWAVAMAMFARWRAAPATVAGWALAGTLCSAAWMAGLHLAGATPSRLYNGLDTRAMALLTGCLLAQALLRSHPGRIFIHAQPATGDQSRQAADGVRHPWDAYAATALLLGCMHVLSWRQPAMFLVGYFMVALLTAWLIRCLVLAPRQACAALLSWPPLVRIGQWSYGLYLWHYPVFRIAEYQAGRYGVTLPAAMLLGALATVTLAAASYHLLELPLRRGYARRRMRALSGAMPSA